jgi:hypothetical protein
MIALLIAHAFNVWIVSKIRIIKDIKLLSKKLMADAATVEMLKPGKNKGFVKSIPDKLLIFKLILNNKKILSQI